MIGHEELMRYLDGELEPEQRRAVEEALERSTELRRELAVFRGLKTDLRDMGANMGARKSVWDDVNRRLTRPLGWTLVLLGAIAWIGFGAYTYLTGADALWEKLAGSAIVLGLVILFASVALDRHKDLKTDPYKEIQR